MNIPKLSTTKYISKYLPLKYLPLAGMLALTAYNLPAKALNQDVFEKQEISVLGVEVTEAPSPSIRVAGDDINASIVVDLSENVLYRYDSIGNPIKAYKVASGKKSTPTHAGIRLIEGIETYPYSKAYGTKRKRNPNDYGPKLLRLAIIDAETGKKKGYNGQFIHGNNNPTSLGYYVSKGCIRMDNEAIKEVSEAVKPGEYVLFTF